MHIHHQDGLPKYHQLKQILRELAKGPDSGMERKLPSERALVERFDVSRATVRKAISDLVAEGLLYCQKGKGTFVAAPQDGFAPPPREHPKSLGLVLSYTAHQDNLSSQVLRGAEQAARLNGYYLIVAVTDGSFDREREIVQELSQAGAKGLIILPADADYELGHEHIAALHRRGYPFILVDRYFRDLEADYVATDNEAGAHKVVAHLLDLGHTRIGHITSGPPMCTTAEDRLSGYKTALSARGLPFREELVERLGEDPDRIRAFIRRLRPPAAVFCLNDGFALRTMRIIREDGLRVPEDVAVVGYDDVENSSPDISLGLATVRQPFAEVGRVAVTRLLRRVSGEAPPDEPQQVVLTSTLVVRQSSGGAIAPTSVKVAAHAR